MKLQDTVTRYVAHKQSLGMRFTTAERTLKSFCCAEGDKDLELITPEAVLVFLAGNGRLTRFWHLKHEVLSGLYRFALARGYVDCSPMPKSLPKLSHRFEPYIFSHAELKRLLQATDPCFANPRCHVDAPTYRALLLLLYGAALRISEALSLTLSDIDLDAAVLQIRESKFYRTRLVPFGDDLSVVLTQHVTRRWTDYCGCADPPLFIRRTGDPLTRRDAEKAFCRLREQANVRRYGSTRNQPRLHDLRHSSATHRLISWYKSGADVQRLLPKLATYLGHIHLSGTQRYLTLTPQLLQQASQRFERYALGGQYE